jgi:hypothetical protein
MADDLYGMLFGGTEDAAQASKAMSDLLRYKKGMALVGSMAGGPMANAAMMEKQAAGEENTQLKGLDNRMRYGQERQQHTDMLVQAKQQHENALLQAKQLHDDKTQEGRAALALTLKQMGLDAQKTQDSKEYDKSLKDIEKLSMDIDASQRARSATGIAAQNIYRSASAQTLLSGKPVPKQFLEDAAITIARIAGGGGNIGEKMADELKAKGISADVAGMMSYLKSRPMDVGMEEWIKVLINKLQQEDETADAFTKQSALKQVSRMSRAAKYAPDDLKRVITAHGLADHVNEDLITPIAPTHLMGRVGKTKIAEDRARIPAGKKLVYDKTGRPMAADPGDDVSSYWEPK